MLTLQSFRLLHPKANSFDIGTGGTPEISFQEVADLLSRCTNTCSMFGRYHYGLDDTMRGKLVDAVTEQMFKEDQALKRPMFPNKADWRAITDMAVMTYRYAIWLTRAQRRNVCDMRRWTRRHEEAFKNVSRVLNDLDYELRSELREWNNDQLEGYV